MLMSDGGLDWVMGLDRVFDLNLDLDGAYAGLLIDCDIGGMHTIFKSRRTGG